MSEFDPEPGKPDDRPFIMYETKEGHIAKTVAPLVRNAKGKHEVVVAVIYTKDTGLPVGLLLCTDTKEVNSAEWEPLHRIG